MSNERVRGLARSMRDHTPEPGTFGSLDGVQAFRQRPDLVDLHKDRIGCLLSDAAFENLFVRHEQVISYQLDSIPKPLLHRDPARPISFIKAVLDRYQRKIVDQARVVLGHFVSSALTALELILAFAV